ncbi:ERMES complex subunit MDM12 [Apiospora arundinis]
MSIDLNWDTLTGGPDGDALAESIRDFIHTKFQAVPLPRFIKSVTVHDFKFGDIPPEVVLKDICDPLPDFYEENPDADDLDEDDDDDEEDEEDIRHGHAAVTGRPEVVPDAIREAERRRKVEQGRRLGLSFAYGTPGSRPPLQA